MIIVHPKAPHRLFILDDREVQESTCKGGTYYLMAAKKY